MTPGSENSRSGAGSTKTSVKSKARRWLDLDNQVRKERKKNPESYLIFGVNKQSLSLIFKSIKEKDPLSRYFSYILVNL